MMTRKIDPGIKSTIAAFGYSENQIEVYFAGLELGLSTAQELSQRSGVDLKTTKEVLKSLVLSNLVEEVVKDEATFHRVAPFEEVFVSRDDNQI